MTPPPTAQESARAFIRDVKRAVGMIRAGEHLVYPQSPACFFTPPFHATCVKTSQHTIFEASDILSLIREKNAYVWLLR